ncbi:glycosyltransferase family 2 protein [Parazoarcus communis]|uniref:Glycosyltransferase family 2 protein n=1 Tax=Parazoarcus communis SWub3 = DSM 12120 TaxID=1121029 RepID=A0A323UX07_9RHOO|nr:glycosyltransferase family 2 protein [Parazoarcus communis]NMG72321.1 rhamnosyltransferase [Parazoarcus communis SWub3 = DSM 12120]PZA16160.1 glycosyltransferase family 2 protein [Azoarcus communis] [Parazoarcus communis SWub3 = DSM 12120]
MIVAVVVTYLPDHHALQRLLAAMLLQVDRIVVVDNGSIQAGTELAGWLDVHFPGRGDALVFVPLGRNFGIAAAQNRGIAHARQLGARYVLLSDQDSLPAADMVARLKAAVESRRDAGLRVAAVGPRYVDERQNNPPPFIRVSGMRVERVPCTCPDAIVEVDYLIASGCLIPMETLDAVGDMAEALFIDYVDIEWGLRAAHHGYQSFGVCSAGMRHDLGETPVRFLGRQIPMHSPLRHYYHVRNAIWLYRQTWPRRDWKLADGWRLLLKYGFYSVFGKPWWKHWQMMSLGVWHGLTGRMGPYR